MQAQRFTNFLLLLKSLDVDDRAIGSPQCQCLAKYLSELQAKSYVLEDEYTDAGYLVDYGGYYARSHESPHRLTRRLHFFELPARKVQSAWRSAIRTGDPDQVHQLALNEKYLGFIVLKPLRRTVIGRTCLKNYKPIDESTGRRRYYPITRPYSVLLYGLRLSLNTVAFQEQDAEVAACATTAIWYTLHALPKRLTTPQIPSPYEITNLAYNGNSFPAPGEILRKFPTKGLSLPQIEACLRSFNLDPLIIGLSPERQIDLLQEYCGTFVRAGNPIIILGELYVSDDEKKNYRPLGMHAITALGFATSQGFLEGHWSNRIERIFAHDDNLGPFSSFHISQVDRRTFEGYLRPGLHLEDPTGWKNGNGNSSSSEKESPPYRHLFNRSGLVNEGTEVFRRFVPLYLAVPIEPKIRLPYETLALFMEQILGLLLDPEDVDQNMPMSSAPTSHFIELHDITTLKTSVLRNKSLNKEIKESILSATLPKHIWFTGITRRGTDDNDDPLLSFLFDATALRQSGGLLSIVAFDARDHSSPTLNRIRKALSNRHLKNAVPASIEPIIRDLRENLGAG